MPNTKPHIAHANARRFANARGPRRPPVRTPPPLLAPVEAPAFDDVFAPFSRKRTSIRLHVRISLGGIVLPTLAAATAAAAEAAAVVMVAAPVMVAPVTPVTRDAACAATCPSMRRKRAQAACTGRPTPLARRHVRAICAPRTARARVNAQAHAG
eukprot:IDg10406t1